MELKELTFGIGLILRERVNGWATTEGGVAHVYPDHPPLDLAKSSYPRGTVDTIGHISTDRDIEGDVEIGEVLVDITAYAVNSGDSIQLLGDAHKAIGQYHDKNNLSGNPYLSNWSFVRTGNVGPVLAEENTDKGFTRYAKTLEFEFRHVTET